jgi:DNA-nicking Smr family endonuclease
VRDEAEEPLRLPVTGELDLHAFAPREIPSLVREYLGECQARGIRDLRLVHGRGRGVQRAVVHRELRGHPGVEWFGDAPPGSGGWGATLVRLRRGD